MRSIGLLGVTGLASLLLVVVVSGLVLPAKAANAGTIIHSTWTDTPPTIDGTFQLGEWSNPQIVFDASTYPSSYVLPTYVYFVNDHSNLYVMVDAAGDATDDSGDESLMWFNYDGAGFALNVVKIVGTSGAEITTPYDAVVGFGGSPNSAFLHKIYEFSIPFSWLNKMPGQSIDFCSPMWKYGSSISYDALSGHDNVWPLGIGAPPIPIDLWGQLDPAAGPVVGGVVEPVNNLTVLAPYSALLGLVAVAAVAVARRKTAC